MHAMPGIETEQCAAAEPQHCLRRSPAGEAISPLLLAAPLEGDVQGHGGDQGVVLDLVTVLQRHSPALPVQVSDTVVRAVPLHQVSVSARPPGVEHCMMVQAALTDCAAGGCMLRQPATSVCFESGMGVRQQALTSIQSLHQLSCVDQVSLSGEQHAQAHTPFTAALDAPHTAMPGTH